MRPRPALPAVLLAAGVLHLLARLTGVPWFALGSAAALTLPVAALLLRPRLVSCTATLRLPVRSVVGQRVDAVLVVTNSGARAVPAVHWSLTHPGLEAVDLQVPALGAGETAELAVPVGVVRRGVFAQADAALTSTAPLGLLRWSRRTRVAAPLVVHPRTTPRRELQAQGAPVTAERSTPVAGSGTELLGLRPWRQGDALRHVSARATARHGRPVVLERERETGPALVLLAAGGSGGEAWERAVSAAASLCLAALHDGVAPQVLADPAPPRTDATALLDFFAGVDACGPLRADDLRRAVAAAGAGGTVLLLAPPGSPETVAAVTRACAAARAHWQVVS